MKQLGIRTFTNTRIAFTQEGRSNPGPSPGEVRTTVTGYRARIGFNIKLNDLDRVDDVVSGLLAAGANELHAVTYQSSVLQEMRKDASRQAVAAAKDKAELYCREVGVSVGRVLSIDELSAAPPLPRPGQFPGAPPLADSSEIMVTVNVAIT